MTNTIGKEPGRTRWRLNFGHSNIGSRIVGVARAGLLLGPIVIALCLLVLSITMVRSRADAGFCAPSPHVFHIQEGNC